MQMSMERLYFTGVLALGVHAVMLLGFNISRQPTVSVSPPLAIALQRAGDAQTIDGSKTAADARPMTEVEATQQSAEPLQEKSMQNPPSRKKPVPNADLFQHRPSRLA